MHVLIVVGSLALAFLAYQFVTLGRYVWTVERKRRNRVDQAMGAVGVTVGRRSEARAGMGLESAYVALVTRAASWTAVSFAEFVALSVACAGGGAGVCILMGGGSWLGFFWGVIGGALPTLWLRERADRRGRAIVRELPGFMDLLTLSVEAGLDFTSAIGRIVERSKPTPLVLEMRTLLMEIRLGSARRTALRNIAARLLLPEVDSLATAIIQADQYGASLGATLRIQSEQIRRTRYQAAERRAGRAAVLVSLPTVLFLIPCVFLILVGPYVGELATAFRGGF